MPLPVVLAASVVPVVVGVLVVRRQRLIGMLLVAHGICFALLSQSSTGATSHLGMVWDQLNAGSWVFLFVWLACIAYLMPSGRPSSVFWRRWVLVGLCGVVVFWVGAAGDSGGFRQAHHGADPPVPWLAPGLSAVLGVVGLLAVVLLLVGSVVAVHARLRGAVGEERLQLLWLVWAATTVPVALLTGWADHFLLEDRVAGLFWAALALSAVALPAAIGVAVLRHRLFDIEVVLSHTLTYATLTTFVLVVYGGLLAVTGRMLGSSSIGGLVAVAVVAVAVHPAYSRVHRGVERWVFGLRSEPHLALRLLAERAEAAEPEALVAAVTEAVAEALRADAVWIGCAGTGVPLVHREEHFGDLVVRLPKGRALAASEESLLRDLTRYAAVVVWSGRLYDEVRDSRARIVAGREEERRRLRRDLHDGVGPSLAAIVLKLNAAQRRSEDQVRRDRLITEAKDEVKTAIAEIRRLVDSLRPPAVDEVGLLQAIRQRAAAFSDELVVEVDGPSDLPALPAAVEVAAFRIASEAMTNAARHSEATRCRVQLSVGGGDLELTVSDNGRGSYPNVGKSATAGVGWISMRERAAELGGVCTVSDCPGGGLLVCAVLPMAREVPAVPTLQAPA